MVFLKKWLTFSEREQPNVSALEKEILNHFPKAEDIREGCEPRFFEQESNERSIILLHGLTDSPYFMTAIGKRFAQLGFNVYIPLLPYHGLKEPYGMQGVSLESWQKTVEAVVGYARTKVGKLSVGGLSTGGTLSVWIANESPELIDGGVFLFSAALDIADSGSSVFKKGDFKERLLRTYCIRNLLSKYQDLTNPLLIGDNPYRYSRMDIDGAGALSKCINLVENVKLKTPLFVAHSEADEAADIMGVEQLIKDHLDPSLVNYYRLGKTLGVPHASVVLESDVFSKDGSPLEPKNPYFNEMMNRVSLFINQKSNLSSIASPSVIYEYKPQVEALKDVFFDYNKGTYSTGIAHWLAYCSEVVYYRQKDEKDITKAKVFSSKKSHHTPKFPYVDLIKGKLKGLDPDFVDVKGFENRSSQAIIIQHKNYLVVSFRGTDEIADWIDSINLRKTVKFKDLKDGFEKSFKKWLGREDSFSTNKLFGRVHQGFYQAFLDVWEGGEMWKELEELIDDTNLPLWITGHSLGGAMATLAAAWMTERNLPIRGVYTFGQPRCGDQDFSLQLNAKLLPHKFFRFHNCNDIIPRLPARLMNFEHTGRLVYITDDYKLDANPARWDRFLETIRGIIEDVMDGDFIPNGIEDHNIIEGYILGISSWKDRNPENW